MLPPGRFVELPARGRTFVRECGEPEGAPVVVLLHGWTATAALNWYPSFAPLANNFRVIALDHRGHGRGLRSRAAFRLEDCADDVAALLGAIGVERCVAVGYSMGGSIAQLLWQRHPNVVDGLVLCATGGDVPRDATRSPALRDGDCWEHPRWRFPHTAARPRVNRNAARMGGDSTLIVVGDRRDRPTRLDPDRSSRSGDLPIRLAHIDAPDVRPNGRHRDPRRRRRPARAAARSGPGDPRSDAARHRGGHSACTSAPEQFVPALVDACLEVAERTRIGGTPAPVRSAA